MAEVRNRAALRRAMTDAGLSAASLSREVGVSRSLISRLVTGARTQCGSEVAYDIEEALGLYPGALFVLETFPARTEIVSDQESAAAKELAS